MKAKGPKEKKRHKRLFSDAKVDTSFHWKNAAAKAEALQDYSFQIPRNSAQLTADVNSGRIAHKYVQPVKIRIQTKVEIDKSGQPQQPKKITLVPERKLKPEDFFIHALAMADITKGNGFRQPSAKEKNFKSTSLMEKLSIKMGVSEPRTGPERSERGEKKHTAQIECNVRIVLDRLIDQYPDRALKAKNEERYVNWFVGKVMEALGSTPDMETLTTLVKERIQERHQTLGDLLITQRVRQAMQEAA